MVLPFGILFCAYLIALIWLIRGWNKAVAAPAEYPPEVRDKKVSVVIAARNEQEHLGLLLGDLARQTDRPDEVIVVNDHSSDDTAGLVSRRIADGFRSLRLLEATGDGKKQALSYGIREASGDIVVTTDADCRVSPEWISAVRRAFDDPGVVFLFGAVRIHHDGTLWSAIQGMEFASLVGSGAAAMAHGVPLFCNGANLAFRRAAFFDAGGYNSHLNLASGDDTFLMLNMHRLFPEGVRFGHDARMVVSTAAAPSARDFLYQRIRWAGKWRRIGARASLTAIAVFLFHLLWLVFVVVGLARGYPREVIVLLTLKALLEYVFLRSVARFTRMRWNGWAFLFWQLFYSLYVVIFGLLAQTVNPEWKGRKIKSMAGMVRD